MLTYAIAMLNGSALTNAYGDLILEINKLSCTPSDFTKIYENIIKSAKVDDICKYSKQLIVCVREFIINKKETKKDNIKTELILKI